MEFILKEELFSGDFVYSLVCINRNQRILIDKLKSNNQIRQLMVGQISHDLRTPLNGIIINLNLAMKELYGISKIIKEDLIKPALSNCDILMCLINDILDFTQEDFDREPKMFYE